MFWCTEGWLKQERVQSFCILSSFVFLYYLTKTNPKAVNLELFVCDLFVSVITRNLIEVIFGFWASQNKEIHWGMWKQISTNKKQLFPCFYQTSINTVWLSMLLHVFIFLQTALGTSNESPLGVLLMGRPPSVPHLGSSSAARRGGTVMQR